MNIYAFLSLITAVIITALGVTVYGVSGRNKNSSIFLLVTIGVGFLNFTQFQMRITHDFQVAYLWAKAYSLWPLILAFSAQFVMDLRRQRNRSILFYIAIYLPAIAITYIQFSTNLITLPPIEKSWGWSILYNQGFFPTLATLIGLIYWIQILVTLLLYIRTKTGILKKTSKTHFYRIPILFPGHTNY